MPMLYSIVLLLSCFTWPAVWGILNQEQVFQAITNTSIYNRRLRPQYYSGEPVNVNTSLYLYGLSTVDDLQLEYHLQMLVRLRWQDDRLNFEDNATDVPIIVGDDYHVARIWIPKIHVVNDRQGGSFLTSQPGAALVHIEPSGRVLLSHKANFRLSYNMKYKKYPMDQQRCEVIIESSTLKEANLILSWAEEEPIALNDRFDLPGFNLRRYELEKTHINYKRTGNFSRLRLSFTLEREFMHFLLDMYLPSGMIVIISCISPWLNIAAAPARVSLGITAMLTLVTITRASREKLPRLPYVHLLDIWNLGCTVLVGITLVEYAVVNFIYHKDKRSRRQPLGYSRHNSVDLLSDFYHNRLSTSTPADLNELAEAKATHNRQSVFTVGGGESRRPSLAPSEASVMVGCQLPITPKHIANGIDRKCRYLFPIMFVVFNAIYWGVAYGSQDE